ncbi:hypothetical protein SAY87_014488 [Trapa incisa]|uniref:ABC-type xenobiotic transporter n=1 Tax=Trapa incisa TaxID=236973 RepID=A0AAN7GW83_9MYRT|nr:hypothetical protein SAY87_014488 [Trapa incisa]
MALSYGLSLNVFLVVSVQFQCILSGLMVSMERVEQYMDIKSEGTEIIEGSRPDPKWPAIGSLRICNLKVRYRPGAPLVLQGITCNIQGGHKVGIVGRTGSGKTTLISTLFRLVEPSEGKIIVDDLDICRIGLHDLRSHLGIIPQEPTLFGGTVRYNLDPLSEHTDEEIWEVLAKCQLREAVQEKDGGLSSLVMQDGSNWSMGQRQLFCLGRALLKRRRILVLDEATASIDNATDSILQRTIRTEFASCTVITVAHRIPTVMDCTMVLGMSDGRLVEYDEPMKLMNREDFLFGQLCKEYWSRTANASSYLDVSISRVQQIQAKAYDSITRKKVGRILYPNSRICIWNLIKQKGWMAENPRERQSARSCTSRLEELTAAVSKKMLDQGCMDVLKSEKDVKGKQLLRKKEGEKPR